MPNFTAPPRLVVTGRLMLPTGEHWLVERERSGGAAPNGTVFRWHTAGEPVHAAAVVRPMGHDLALREIDIAVFGPYVDDSWLPQLN
ncbi:MAG: hypothetical protein V3W14_08745 [Candidatus Neomarinimicrobiota bacterium]